MNNHYPISNHSDFEVMIPSPLSNYEQKILLKLYMPLIGNKAISLYQSFYSFVLDNMFESEIEKHEKIVRMMHLRSIEKFQELSNKLQAIGLLDLYYKDGLYIYLLKKPLDPHEYFNNIELSTLLEYELGHEGYLDVYLEFMMRKLDINKFENITRCFNDVFDIELSDTIEINLNRNNNKNNGIVINSKDFDYDQFMILTSTHDIIDTLYFTDQEFIDIIYRYSFLYHLNPEEMKNVVIMSCDENKKISYQEIRINAKKVYEEKNQRIGIIPKNIVNQTSTSNDKLIRYLEIASPNDFVKNKTGVELTSTEIEMFDRLLLETNINIGTLNVLIGYVLENLNGEIPSYNYFLKVINTWKRSGVKSTQDAIDQISGKTKSTNKKSYKPKKDVPDWYQGYVEDINKRNENNTSKKESGDLEALKDFFNPSNKE